MFATRFETRYTAAAVDILNMPAASVSNIVREVKSLGPLLVSFTVGGLPTAPASSRCSLSGCRGLVLESKA